MSCGDGHLGLPINTTIYILLRTNHKILYPGVNSNGSVVFNNTSFSEIDFGN
jgi:hypothetical protein